MVRRGIQQNNNKELVGTATVCDAENLQWIGGGFERYGSFGEEDALVGVGGC